MSARLGLMLGMALCSSWALGAPDPAAAYLSKIADPLGEVCHYQNQIGQIIVAARPCDETIDYGTELHRLPFALVFDQGWQAYGPSGAHLFEVFMFDNGPDEPAEGLIRIERAGRLGYASVATGNIVVPPLYQCALPFRDGWALVGLRCQKVYEPSGEHWYWEADEWLRLPHPSS
ncbi:MAG: hypothetical protein KA346_02335 [Neisseriaceae bacterium]|nr:hypothetical protein [Neisseriaceae bacterium]